MRKCRIDKQLRKFADRIDDFIIPFSLTGLVLGFKTLAIVLMILDIIIRLIKSSQDDT